METEQLRAALERLEGRVQAGMKYDLHGISALLALLGQPERAVKSVLVVGTNGKGSTAALVAAALQRSGHRVGRFTSPHLIDFAERITLDGRPIDQESLYGWLQRIEALEPKMPRAFSFFEGAMAIAAGYLAAAQAHVVVWEAGLGGRLDATNSLPTDQLLAVAITPIAMDHEHILGRTLEEIATEKAAVIRPGVPVISAPQAPAAAALIEAQARRVGAPLTWAVPPDEAALPGPQPRSWRAPYLRHNAALAASVCQAIDHGGLACPQGAVAAAAAQFVWPGRYQWLNARPHRLRRVPWLLDAGHNPHGCAAFAEGLKQDARIRNRHVRLLFGALNDKPVGSMLAPLLPLTNEVHLVVCPSPRSHGQATLREAHPEATIHGSLDAALNAMTGPSSGRPSVNLACGSITLLGALLRALDVPATPV